jgi:hypothetical protein
VRKAAAYRAAAAEFTVADPGQRHAQERNCGGERVVLEAALPHRRPHVEGVVGQRQVVEAFDGVDVDEKVGAA